MTASITVTEPPRETPVVAECEVLVLGGGPAGIAAATAAARTGARTLLLERYGFLGGMGTAAMVTNFCGLHATINGSIQQVVRGVADDILDRLDRLDGLKAPHPVPDPNGGIGSAAQAYDTAAYKLAADDLGYAWVLKQDRVNPDLLFLGTELGLYISMDAGNNWEIANAPELFASMDEAWAYAGGLQILIESERVASPW